MSKEELIQFFAEHGFLIDPDFLEEASDNVDKYKLLESLKQEETLVITNELLLPIKEKEEILFVEDLVINNPKVEILESFKEKTRKIEVQDFVSYFKSRYNQLKEILQGRNELRNATSISRLKGKTNERAVLIGMINTKRVTKNDHLILELEDLTGKINVLIAKNREIYSHAKELVLDEVIGISGNLGDNILFADQIFFPDVPVTKELKKSTEEEYALFISDLHIGNKDFLKKEFENFLEWINGRNVDASQEQIIQKINYLFISGDIIESVNSRGGQVQIRYGTGVAPANSDVLTGTTAGGLVKMNQNNLANRMPFSLNSIVTGLTVGTAYWIDLSLARIGASGTATISDISISVIEL